MISGLRAGQSTSNLWRENSRIRQVITHVPRLVNRTVISAKKFTEHQNRDRTEQNLLFSFWYQMLLCFWSFWWFFGQAENIRSYSLVQKSFDKHWLWWRQLVATCLQTTSLHTAMGQRSYVRQKVLWSFNSNATAIVGYSYNVKHHRCNVKHHRCDVKHHI